MSGSFIESAGPGDKGDSTFPEVVRCLREIIPGTPVQVAEIGCGRGNFLTQGIVGLLDEEILKHISYTGIDPEPDGMEEAKTYSTYQMIDARLAAPPRFIASADFNETGLTSPVPDASVDFAFLIRTLHDIHLDDLSMVMFQIFRILKPGGMLVIYDKGNMAECPEVNYVLWSAEDLERLFAEPKYFDKEIRPHFSTEKQRNEVIAEIRKPSSCSGQPGLDYS